MKPHILAVSILLLFFIAGPAHAEEWVEYQPTPAQTEIHLWTSGSITYSRVKFTFYDCGYRVVDPGTLQRNGDDFFVNLKVERWTGVTCLMLTTFEQIYKLDTLAPGAYTFTVGSRSAIVKSQRFDPVQVVEHWEPFIPAPESGSISVRSDAGVTFPSPTISCGDTPCRATEWGPVMRTGNDFAVDVKMERWTGQPTRRNGVQQSYSLGPVPPGSYSFTLTSRGILIRRQPFNVTGATGQYGNPIDFPAFFVRQHYLDFLGREPEQAGFQGWQDILSNCQPGSTTCDRIEVSSAFYRSPEFQDRGYFIYRFYSTALGRFPHYAEFMPDLQRVSGFLTPTEQEANKVAFINEFMSRQEFRSKYDALTDPAAYVNLLVNTAGVTLASKDALIADLQSGRKTRAEVLRQIAESAEVYQKYYNQSFVVMQYFGYLRRDPDALYQNWIQTLNNTGDYRMMVNGFMNSLEYRRRFGQ